ncbi:MULTISPECIES: sugar phosphate isomerase/epimerase family protein [Virgibacillus]|uniref:L-ribulose-5-phosphate 3-epimerase UlaE n=2 Tax=Virgibacillus TaxID=84406 RepID=A0A024Q688_9BACI|nr:MULTISPECIES: sugar phosphate isomerase/epimerase family protein [Virgibacillus]EQB38471.1 xylose isomerase [Virgibacillus sp. CM-4]MYL41178.1 TIM barrel protein [Virgibacillus massiliensis]GGJ54863.1 xylose isomerase [Virgibacillus kapii]CDQ38018.1 L-ribulose-5-phosphate 3-epimerase UlaE [Virgibacillus massiliensis]
MSKKLDIQRLSLNQITTENWSLQEAIQGCTDHQIPVISVWRHKIAEVGLLEAKKLIAASGLEVSSVCRGGMFPALTASERKERIDDNKYAIEEAAELGADVLVLVCGPSPHKDLAESRKWVQQGIEEIIPFAEQHGVKLGIEPLHPMFAADRSVITTLGEANALQQSLGSSQVGVIIDAFHVWWDPDLYSEIEKAAGKILGYHVSDWKVPLPDIFKGRSMMGDGVIDLPRIRRAVEANGYHGPIEVEIINQAIWDMPGKESLELIKQRFLSCV